MSGLRQAARVMDAVLADVPTFPRVPLPFDVTDAEQFLEIALATARKTRGDA